VEPNEQNSGKPGEIPRQSGVVYRSNGTRFPEGVTVTTHDFRRPAALSQGSLNQMELVHKKFAEHLAARLSTFLRMDCLTNLGKFETPTYSSFIESLESPAEVALLQIEPLLGVAVLNISLPLCHAMIDRMLGGRGVAAKADQSLSEIEIALLEDAVQVMADEWCRQWRSETKLRPHCIGHDTSARLLKTSLPDAVTLSAAVEVQLGESQGQIQLGVPYSMVETMVKEAQARESTRGAELLSRKPQWRSSYNGISVPVVAEWKVKEMRVQELVSLSPGDVLPMDPDLISRTHVHLANSREFVGSIGIQNGRVAVQLTKHLALE
jgi:flagellar motor switch protein FliM